MNFKFLSFQKISSILLITISTLLLISCGDDKPSSNSLTKNTLQKKVQKFSKEAVLKGIVSNKKGTLHLGEIKASDRHNKLVATTQLAGNSHYAITIPKETELPITLTFYPAKGSPNKDKLVSIAIHTAIKKYDINDLTTAIAKKAKALGGYTHSNMIMAADSTVGVPDANKTSSGFKGDPTKQYGGWH